MIYEATIQYIAIDKNGNDKSVKESYVVENADIFAEVETKLYEDFGAFTSLDVIAIKRSRVKEIVNTKQSEDDRIWLAELQDTFTTEEDEEKEMRYKVLLFAKTFDGAKEFVAEYSKQGYNMSLVSLKLTKFVDIL